MKALKIIGFVVLALFIMLSITVIFFVRTFDINKYRAQIVHQISESLGRPVEIDSLGLQCSLKNGLNLTINGLKVDDDPQFQKEPLLLADSVLFDVEITPFLQNREIVVNRISINSPRLRIVRNSSGALNLEKLGPAAVHGEDQAHSPAGTAKSDSKQNSSSIQLPVLLAKDVSLNNAKIHYEDFSVTPAVSLDVDQVDFTLSNFSLVKPFGYEGSMAFLNAKKNIRFKGKGQLDLKNTQVMISDLSVETNASDFDLKQIESMIPVKDLGGLPSIKGNLEVSISQLILGAKGILLLAAESDLKNGALSVPILPAQLENLTFHLKASEADLQIKKVSCNLFGGTITVDGRIDDYLTDRTFSMNVDLDSLSAGEVASKYALPLAVQGKIFGTVGISGDLKDPALVITSSIADIKMELKEGKLLDINVIRLVLSKLSFIPNLAEIIEQNLPENYREKLNKKETVIQKATLKGKLSQGKVTQEVEAAADGFNFKATGDIGLDQNINLNSFLDIDKDLSLSFVSSVPELSALLDEKEQIHVPFKPYQGQLADFRLMPDVGGVSQKIIKEKGKDELKKVIFKALDIEEPQPQATAGPDESGAPQSSGEGQQPAPKPEQVIIENILDKVFK